MTQPALLAAIAANDLAALERAVHHNVHGACETDADSGRNALHEAAALGRAQALVILFRYLRGYPGLDRSGASPLLLALRGGLFVLLPERHQALVQRLVDGQDFALAEALALFAPSQMHWRP